MVVVDMSGRGERGFVALCEVRDAPVLPLLLLVLS